uniref:Uncharacterized protein n=2 Tax=Clastoptera arizonana TaxID=38151 RepID=A0A1B6CB06_9HEMI
MHFWIDKRSQTCGFSGRHRVPSSISASGGGGRRWRGAKPMVTPVHRFQPIECVAGQYAHSHTRRPTRHPYLTPVCPPYRVDSVVNGVNLEIEVRANAAELDSSVFIDLPVEGLPSVAAHIQPPQLEPVGKVKCGMWASFALATVFVAGAKFYFDHQGTGLEILVFSTLMIVFLLAACSVSLCRSKATRDLLSAAVTVSNQTPAHPPPIPTLQIIQTTNIDGTSQQVPPHIEPPPPPYHIAILLPQQINQEEVPPPSYDKAVS